MKKNNIIIISMLVIILALLIVIIVLSGKIGKKNDCNCTSKTTTEDIDYVITRPIGDENDKGYMKKEDYTSKIN